MTAPAPTLESVDERTASIRGAIARITLSAEKYAEISRKNLGDPAQAAETSNAQNDLALAAKKLLLEVQGPLGGMFELIGAVRDAHPCHPNLMLMHLCR